MQFSTSFASTGVVTVNLDYGVAPFNVNALLVLSSSAGTATGGFQYTLDDIQTVSSSLVRWIADANTPITTSFSGSSMSAATTYSVPITALRCTVSAVSSASVELKVLQGLPR